MSDLFSTIGGAVGGGLGALVGKAADTGMQVFKKGLPPTLQKVVAPAPTPPTTFKKPLPPALTDVTTTQPVMAKALTRVSPFSKPAPSIPLTPIAPQSLDTASQMKDIKDKVDRKQKLTPEEVDFYNKENQKKAPTLSAQTSPGKTWEQLPSEGKFSAISQDIKTQKVKGKEDVKKNVVTFFNALGSSMASFGQRMSADAEQKATQATKDAAANPNNFFAQAQPRVINVIRGAITEPIAAVGEGVQDLTGGADMQQAPRVVRGATKIVFNSTLAPVFNGLLAQPEVKPYAEKAFGILQAAKDGIKKIPGIKDLPTEVQDGIDTAVDIVAFKLLHSATKAAFKTTGLVEVPDPTSPGEMATIKVPTDRKWWGDFKTKLTDNIIQLRKNPVEFFKENQFGLSIKNVNEGEVPTPKNLHPEIQKHVDAFQTNEPAALPAPGETTGKKDLSGELSAFLPGGEKVTMNEKQRTPSALSQVKKENVLAQERFANEQKTATEGIQKVSDLSGKQVKQNIKEYDPTVSDKLMEEGRKNIKVGESRESAMSRITTDWYDQYANLLRPNKEGETAKSYLYANNFRSRIAENVRSSAEELKGIYDTLPKELQNTFDDLQVHEHLVDRGRQGLDNPGGITTAQATARIADLRSKLTVGQLEKIDAAKTQLQNWKKMNIIDPLVESGIISPKIAAEWETKYPNHLPVQVTHYLEAQGFGDANSTLKTSKKGFLNKAEGTTSQLDTDTFRVRMRQALQVRSAIEKDRVGSQILKDFGDPMLQDEGMTKEQFEARNPGKSFVVDPASQKKYVVPKEIESVVNNLHAESMGMVEKTFSKMASLLRTGATSARVAFTFTNFLRDLGSAKMFLGKDFSYLRDVMPAAAETLLNNLGIKKSDYVEALKKAGGLNAGAITSESVNLRNSEFQPWNRKTNVQKIWTVVSKSEPLYQAAKLFGGTFEETTRVAATKAWDRLPKEKQAEVIGRLNPKYEAYVVGKDPVDAKDLQAFISKRSTLDFGQLGQKGKIVNRLIPFLNANQKGYARTIQLAHNAPKTFAINTIKYAVLPTLAAWAWNKSQGGDSDVDDLTKAKYFALKTGITTTGDDGKEKPLLIVVPKGESGIQDVSNLLQGTLDAVYNHNPGAFKQSMPVLSNLATGDVKGAATAAGTKITDLLRIPGITPIFEALANYDVFKNKPIVPVKLQNNSPEMQYTLRTPGAYKALGSWAGLSPLQVEHFINGIFPAASQYAAAGDLITGQKSPTAENTSKFFPLIRPSYNSDPAVNAAYQAERAAKQETADSHKLITDKLDEIVRMGSAKGRQPAMDYIQSLGGAEQDYALNYLQKAIEKKSNPDLTNALQNISAAGALKYASPLLDEAIASHDKAKVKEIIGQFKEGSKAQEALIDYFLSKVENQ